MLRGGPLAGRLNQQAERLGSAAASSGVGRARNPMFWLHTARPTCRARGENRKNGDRDGLPKCCWKRRANASPASRHRLSGIPNDRTREPQDCWCRPAMQTASRQQSPLIRDPAARPARRAAWRGCGAISTWRVESIFLAHGSA